ncbi:sigma-like protein [Streptomyces sp. NBC_00829]|uniref:sigma-like protein n=1 Tax=Streptomyces sp. NBC_00829 TaxID=2903679 RepID=UPI0038696546|nr:sigma-like protein [Streptomyces sp. NBC_00829]
MSEIKKNLKDITTMGDNHSPAPPVNGLIAEGSPTEPPVTTQGDNHSPVPPKLAGGGGATTQGDNHSPVPPKG